MRAKSIKFVLKNANCAFFKISNFFKMQILKGSLGVFFFKKQLFFYYSFKMTSYSFQNDEMFLLTSSPGPLKKKNTFKVCFFFPLFVRSPTQARTVICQSLVRYHYPKAKRRALTLEKNKIDVQIKDIFKKKTHTQA